MKVFRSSIFKACASLGAFLLVSSSSTAMQQSGEQQACQQSKPIIIPENTFKTTYSGIKISFRQERHAKLIQQFAGTIVAKAVKSQFKGAKQTWEDQFKLEPMPKTYHEWEPVIDKIQKSLSQEACGHTEKYASQSDKKTSSALTTTVNTGEMDYEEEATFYFDFEGSATHEADTYSGVQAVTLKGCELNDSQYWQAKQIFPSVLQFVAQKLQDYEAQEIDWEEVERTGLEQAQKFINEQCGTNRS